MSKARSPIIWGNIFVFWSVFPDLLFGEEEEEVLSVVVFGGL